MRFHRVLAKLFIVGFALWLTQTARAEVKPHALFSDNMILQRDRQAKIWGTAEKGEKVEVSFRGKQVATTTGEDDKWQVQIATQDAGGPFVLTIAGKNSVTLKNVMVGDVWVCSGQSNMWWPVAARAGSKEVLGTENPSIRLFNVPGRMLDQPTGEVEGAWQECGPASLVQFSAVAYFFGRDLQRTQNIPIGLIHASYGGSGVTQWMSTQAMAEDPELAPLREKRTREAVEQIKKNERLKPDIERYEAALALAKKEGKPLPIPPRGMSGPPVTSRLYNGMIAPLMPFGIRGAIWYQGEANVRQAADYQALFGTLIRGWRREWGQGDFPFLFVQLAPHLKIVDQPQESNWAAQREAQLRTSQTVPNTGMVVITDWGHETDIHVKQKQPVGERLALLARALVYNESLVHSGPRYQSQKLEGNRFVVTFTHGGDGLVTKRLVLEDVSTDSRAGTGGALHVAKPDAADAHIPLQGFTIAGEDHKFVNAQAEIHGNTVVVFSPRVEKPVAVRYGWADYPTGNLFNSAGLPASPFRTDDWLLPVVP